MDLLHFILLGIFIVKKRKSLSRSFNTMRLRYVPDPPNFTNENDKAVEQRVRQRRGEKGLIALDRTLLHAPQVADGWYTDLYQHMGYARLTKYF